MISSIRGKLIEKSPESIVVDVGGIGYQVFVSSNSYSQLPNRGEEVHLQTHLYLREDLMQLYGFASSAEKRMFEQLISVSKIGPKVALSILSALSPSSLSKAILRGDLELISSVPGVGKKTAQRIVLELKDKVSLPELEVLPASAFASDDSTHLQARNALVGLGYTLAEARKALENLPAEEEISVEEMLRQALKNLA